MSTIKTYVLFAITKLEFLRLVSSVNSLTVQRGHLKTLRVLQWLRDVYHLKQATSLKPHIQPYDEDVMLCYVPQYWLQLKPLFSNFPSFKRHTGSANKFPVCASNAACVPKSL